MAGQHLLAFPTVILYVLGGLGPVAVASLLVAGGRWDATLDRTAFEFLRRAFDPRTLAWRWYLSILGLGLFLSVMPVLLDLTVLREHGLLQRGLGLGTPAFWTFNLVILVESPIYAWLYNKAGRVPLAAVLFHALGNVLGELIPDASNVANVGVTAALALILTFAAWSLMGRRCL